MPDTLTIIDNRTGKRYELPIEHGTIRAIELRHIKTDADDFGLMTYDPAFMNTAACKSAITYIDGDKGILRYRGYPIEQLAEESSFIETAYLILHGELPNASQLASSRRPSKRSARRRKASKTVPRVSKRPVSDGRFLPRASARCRRSIRSRAADLDDESPARRCTACSGKAPTLAAYAYRHRRPPLRLPPSPGLAFAGTSWRCCSRTEGSTRRNPVLSRALDILFVLHADHEQNCSTFAMRAVGSSHADLYRRWPVRRRPCQVRCTAAPTKRCCGCSRRSAGEPRAGVHQAGEGRRRAGSWASDTGSTSLYDPRAKIIKRTADEVFEVTGKNPLLEIAMELERIALQDEYFVTRRLYPNVDFYSGLIYQAMGFPTDMFPVLFAIPRVAGWLAQWEESLLDPDTKITRPRQVYIGSDQRDYVPMANRS